MADRADWGGRGGLEQMGRTAANWGELGRIGADGADCGELGRTGADGVDWGGRRGWGGGGRIGST